MLKKGPDVSMITGEPEDAHISDKEQQERKSRETRLKEKLEDLGISKTPEAHKVFELIQSRAIERIQKLIAEDPEMQAYMKVLGAFDKKEGQAARAYEELIKRFKFLDS